MEINNIKDVKFYLQFYIGYYYSIKPEARAEMEKDPFLQKSLFPHVELIENIIKGAPERLRQIYSCLYVKEMTQKQASLELGISKSYVQRLNKDLLEYVLKELESAA